MLTSIKQTPPDPHWVYLTIAFYMSGLVLFGFWPTFYGSALTETLDLSPILRVHGAVFTGWMVLLVTQALLASRGCLNLHRSLGRVGAGYAVLVVGLGFLAAGAGLIRMTEASDPLTAVFFIISVGDTLLFGSFVAAAIVYRREPATHKRLMVVATVVLMGPAASRITESLWLATAIWLSPLCLALGFELVAQRRLSRPYLFGFAVLILSGLRVPVGFTAWWRDISERAYALLT